MVFPVWSVSLGLIAFSVGFEIVKFVDFNEIEPKASSDVEFFVSCFVVDVDDIDDAVDIVDVVEVVIAIVEFSLSVVLVFFKSPILFISGKIFIVAKNFINKLQPEILNLLYQKFRHHHTSNFLHSLQSTKTVLQ